MNICTIKNSLNGIDNFVLVTQIRREEIRKEYLVLEIISFPKPTIKEKKEEDAP